MLSESATLTRYKISQDFHQSQLVLSLRISVFWKSSSESRQFLVSIANREEPEKMIFLEPYDIQINCI